MIAKRFRRVVVGASTLLLAGAGLTVLPAAAHADPGFCGVKGDVQAVPGGPAQVTYFYAVRNRCSSTLNFQAYDVAAPRTATYCLPISGGATRALPMGAHYAKNWAVRICKP